jgi:hypothetical protein
MAIETIGSEGESSESTLEDELRRIVKAGVEDAHDDGTVQHDSARGGRSGRSQLPLLFVAGALGIAGVLLWRRSGDSASTAGGGVTERVRSSVDRAADRAEDIRDRAVERVDERGDAVADRTEAASEEVAQRVAEGGETVAERADEASETAAERVAEGGEAASGRIEGATDSGDEGETAGSQ